MFLPTRDDPRGGITSRASKKTSVTWRTVAVPISATRDDGKVFCSCPTEMILSENGTVCVARNKCLLDNGGCSHDCHYDDDEVSCSCPFEMILADDKHLCIYENKCLLNNGGCSDICAFNEGSISCECPSGFRLSIQDNATCIDINECFELKDNCTHNCVKHPRWFRVQLQRGLQGELRWTCVLRWSGRMRGW